jgi:hypothetical protein
MGDVELPFGCAAGEGMLGRAEISSTAGRRRPCGPRAVHAHDLVDRAQRRQRPRLAVSQRYAAPFDFTGVLHEVVIQASPEKYADNAAVAERAEMSVRLPVVLSTGRT